MRRCFESKDSPSIHWLILLSVLCVSVLLSPAAMAENDEDKNDASSGEKTEEETGKNDEEGLAAEKPDESFAEFDEQADYSTGTEVEIEKLTDAQMNALEERLSGIREKVFESKSRLKLLLDQLRMGSVSLNSLSMQHTHDVGATFKLESMKYTLDGFVVYHGVSSDELDLEKFEATPVYEGSLLPGEHMLVVDMIFRGKGFGIFSYLKRYLFKVKSRYVFHVQEGDVATILVTSYDDGSFLTSLKDRLKVRFERK
jgi:hypothetical protein